jgi:hypothetical protein
MRLTQNGNRAKEKPKRCESFADGVFIIRMFDPDLRASSRVDNDMFARCRSKEPIAFAVANDHFRTQRSPRE